MKTLLLAAALREQVAAEARAALPLECCGLVEGTRNRDQIRALALHPAQNLAQAPNRFEIDPAAQFGLMRSLRGSGREVVGCYHSHPSGHPGPSLSDASSAQDANFVWLIWAGMLSAWLWAGEHFEPLAIAETAPLAL